MAQKDTGTAPTGRNLQHPLIPPLVCLILAVGAAVGAFFESAILQVMLIILAILLSAYTVMLYVAALLNTITTTTSWRREHAKHDIPEDIERAVLALVPDAPGEIRVGDIGH